MCATTKTLEGYFENGQFHSKGQTVTLPENRQVVIVMEQDDAPAQSRAARQREALERFWKALDDTPPLPPEFDEAIARQRHGTREVDL